MKKISNSVIIIIIRRLLILLVIAKSISLILWWYLPNEGVELKVKQNYQQKYRAVDFKNMIHGIKKEPLKVASSDGENINSMVLKGIYGNSNSGYVIIALKSNDKKTEIVGVGEVCNGYTLVSIGSSSAKFTKNDTEYVLSLKKSKEQGSSLITKVQKK